MPRATKEEVDAEIIDRAAALFARHGFKQTSVQAIADAVGYSKAGLLHRFPSKDALETAVLRALDHAIASLADHVTGLAPGAERDRAAVTAITDLALTHPGYVALVLDGVRPHSDEDSLVRLDRAGVELFALFGATDEPGPRVIRIISALGGVAIASLEAEKVGMAQQLRPEIIAAAIGALGHRPSPPVSPEL